MSSHDKNPQVSIIIPVYNVEKYLKKCVNSVLQQTLTNIEIILVDDGSTDNSGVLCDEYLRDPRVHVIHKKNGGLSEARNAGVKAAKSDFIGFIDSDDYIKKDMYELLYTNIIKENADISVCGIYDVYANGTKLSYAESDGRFVVNAKKAIELVLHGRNASVSAVNKLYKKNLLEKHPFLVGKTSEDAHFIIPYLLEIQKAVFDMMPKYFYVHREGTITTRPFKKSDLSIVEAYENNKSIIERHYPELIEVAKFRYFWSLFYVLDKMFRTNSFGNDGEYLLIVKTIKKEYLNILSNRYVGKARKLAVTGLMIHRKFYELCLQVYIHKKKQLISN